VNHQQNQESKYRAGPQAPIVNPAVSIRPLGTQLSRLDSRPPTTNVWGFGTSKGYDSERLAVRPSEFVNPDLNALIAGSIGFAAYWFLIGK